MATVPARILRESPPLRRPTEEEIKQAHELCLRLGFGSDEGSAPVRAAIREPDGTEGEMDLPPLARTILEYVLAEMAAGNGMMLSPLHPHLTPFEAAGLLGVSPSYLTGLMDSGELPYRSSGASRRIVFEDLMTYKKKNDEARRLALDELVAQAQELGMGY